LEIQILKHQFFLNFIIDSKANHNTMDKKKTTEEEKVTANTSLQPFTIPNDPETGKPYSKS